MQVPSFWIATLPPSTSVAISSMPTQPEEGTGSEIVASSATARRCTKVLTRLPCCTRDGSAYRHPRRLPLIAAVVAPLMSATPRPTASAAAAAGALPASFATVGVELAGQGRRAGHSQGAGQGGSAGRGRSSTDGQGARGGDVRARQVARRAGSDRACDVRSDGAGLIAGVATILLQDVVVRRAEAVSKISSPTSAASSSRMFLVRNQTPPSFFE